MSNVVLVNLPYPVSYMAVDAMEDFRGGHLGLGYLAAVLDEAGIETEIIDCPRFKIELKNLVSRIRKLRPRILGITFYHINVSYLYRLLAEVGNFSEKPLVVLGGHQATSTAESLVKSNRIIDCVILSEGERTIKQLVCNYLGKQDWKKVNGIVYLSENGNVKINPPQILIDNLDELPIPKRVFEPGQKRAGIMVTRGCYGRCIFCSSEMFYSHTSGKILRTRSAENVISELKFLYDNGITFIQIHSDNFLMADKLSPGWLDIFCSLMEENNINIRFQIFARSDQIREDIIKKLMKVGLHCIFLGVESGIQERLDFFNKNLKVEDNRIAVLLLHKLGLKVKIGFIPFDPDTRLEDLLLEINFLRDINYCETGAYLAEPFGIRFPLAAFPGTKIYYYLQQNGRLSNNQYGYLFKDTRMDIFCSKISLWQELLKEFTWKTEYYYYAEETGAKDIFSSMNMVIQNIISLDLNVIEELIKRIISDEDKAEIPESNYEKLKLLVHQFNALCK